MKLTFRSMRKVCTPLQSCKKCTNFPNQVHWYTESASTITLDTQAHTRTRHWLSPLQNRPTKCDMEFNCYVLSPHAFYSLLSIFKRNERYIAMSISSQSMAPVARAVSCPIPVEWMGGIYIYECMWTQTFPWVLWHFAPHASTFNRQRQMQIPAKTNQLNEGKSIHALFWRSININKTFSIT